MITVIEGKIDGSEQEFSEDKKCWYFACNFKFIKLRLTAFELIEIKKLPVCLLEQIRRKSRS